MLRQQIPDIMGEMLAAKTEPTVTLVALSAIQNDGGTQMRAALNPDTILEYETAIRESGAWTFPPIILFYDGQGYWLADGFHRVGAAHRAQVASVPADVRPGTRRDAILYAAGANASHGLRRTNADKKRAVDTLLRDEEWSKWSDSEIGRRCQVDHKTVAALRKELEATWEIPKSDTRTGADGRTINTTNIGRTASPAEPNYAKIWMIEDIVRHLSAEPAVLRQQARDGMGHLWPRIINKLSAYRRSDVVQALNNVAAQLEAKTNGTNFAPSKYPGDPGYEPTIAPYPKPAPAVSTPTPASEPPNTECDDALLEEVHGLTPEPPPRPVTPAAPVAIPIVPAVVPVSQRDDYDSDEWYTPAEYIAAAKKVMGLIDLDPASSDLAQTVVQAGGYLRKEDDGLIYPWRAETIWLNPPYSQPALWVEKLISEFQTESRQIKHAIILVNNATETAWFQSLLARYPLCLPAGRLAFWRHDHAGITARQGQAIFYLGPDIKYFVEVFGQFGPVLGRWLQ